MSKSVPTADLILARVRVRARRLARWVEHRWSQGRSSPDQGLSITAGEVGRLLDDPAAEEAARCEFYAHDAIAAALAGEIAAADAALAADAGWARLQAAFELTAAEQDLLCVVLAEALAPELQRVIAYLHDDVRQARPTPKLAGELFDRPAPAAAPELEHVLRWRLAQPAEGQSPWRADTGWSADPALALSIREGEWRDPSLAGAAQLEAVEDPEAPAVIYPSSLAALQALWAAERGGARPVQIDILGVKGSGRRTLAGQFARGLGRPLLAVDAERLLADGRPAAAALTAVFRLARHAGAICYWAETAQVRGPDWVAARELGDLVLRGCSPDGQAGADAPAVKLPSLTTAERLAVWQAHSRRPPPPILATQRLTPAEIALVARAAPGGPDAVRDALRRSAPPQSELLTPLPCPYRWEDLILTPDVHRQLRDLEAHVRLRWSVFEDWGFERLAHLGHGVATLFGGASGTGKTMAAQVVARELGLDLYRVDLAGVVNKYVGETEKRLRDVFDVCERAGVLLFFDEADALFGQRMQVKDSHDRFANIEIDYLLQRIERFDGVAILATNRKSDLDAAFLRRLRFIVDFMPPGPEEREILWRRALPPAAPNGEVIVEDLDWRLLAERLHQMTGADIKASALGAAFLAKAEGERIGMRHVLAAAQREITKRGLVLRAPLREARS